MDEQLMKLVFGEGDSETKGRIESKFKVYHTDLSAGEIEIEAATGAHRYTLRPLGELYAPGGAESSPDPTDNRYLPLFMGIEESIVSYDESNRALTDARVSLALDRLSLKPEGDVGDEPLALAVQGTLRLALSVGEYTRQEVRGALRKIGKSVARHGREGGPRGYLRFIRGQLRR